MSYRITEERLGASFDCEADDVLLRSGLRAALPLAYECNAGGCGSCKFDLLEGEIHDLWPEAPGLSARDRGRGRRLACQSRPTSNCRIRMAGRGEPAAAPPPSRQTALLRQVIDLTPDMREFQFVVPSAVAFQPGQYALLSPVADAAPRAYSMCNVANGAGEWHFIIRRVPGGSVSRSLFDLEPGSRVGLDGPYGHAYLRHPSDRNVVCVAGGSGLSPMIGIMRGLDHADFSTPGGVDFFYGGRRAEDICGEALPDGPAASAWSTNWWRTCPTKHSRARISISRVPRR